MAFQSNVQAPDMISLALNLMQMKRQQELEDRKLALQEAQVEAERRAEVADQMKHKAYADAAASGDPKALEMVWAYHDPEGYSKFKLTPPKGAADPNLDWIYRENGDKMRATVNPDGSMTPIPGAVWVPPRPPIQIDMRDGGLNPYQTAETRDKIITKHETASKPYVETTSRLNELDGILASLGKGEPTPFQSEAAATAFAKGLKPAEAVMRDDISRILGQGFMNQVKGFFNLPQKASRAQIQQMREALAQVQSVAEMRQRAIDAKYRGLGSDYEVQIPEYVPNQPGVATGQPQPLTAAPQGAPPAPAPIPAMTEADRIRIEKQIRKLMGITSSQITPSMVIDAWKAEHGQQKVPGM